MSPAIRAVPRSPCNWRSIPQRVQTLALLELSLLSIPAAAGLLEKAGPAFKDYAEGRREAALATFMSAVSGLEWDACRALLEERIPGAVTQSIADADTFFGVELPALSAWPFGAEQAARVSQPVLSVVGSQTQPLWVEVADRLRSWFGQVEECTIEGAGHLLHIQRSVGNRRSISDAQYSRVRPDLFVVAVSTGAGVRIVPGWPTSSP